MGYMGDLLLGGRGVSRMKGSEWVKEDGGKEGQMELNGWVGKGDEDWKEVVGG